MKSPSLLARSKFLKRALARFYPALDFQSFVPVQPRRDWQRVISDFGFEPIGDTTDLR